MVSSSLLFRILLIVFYTNYFKKIQALLLCNSHCTKVKFSIKDNFSKCYQILKKQWIYLHLLKKSLIRNFIFCAVSVQKPDFKVKHPIRVFKLFFSIDILLHIHLSNIKTLSRGTNILGVPGKNIKRNS